MSRPVQIALGVGALGLLAWVVLALSGLAVMPSYLAAWLFCLSLPLGALPVLMLLELLGILDWRIEVPLRRFLLLQPVATLFALPVLLRLGTLYDRPGLEQPLPHDWMAPGFLAARMIASLLIWTALSLLFATAPRRRPRRALAALGLCVHFPLVTLAALDWVMSLDPGLASSAFGLLVASGQVSIALCAAVFVLAVGSDGRPLPSEAMPLLVAALACWMFLHFIQFLVVWSANRPAEIVWYQHRIGGSGAAMLWFGFTASVLAFAMLLPHRLSRTSSVLAGVSAMLLLVHLLETLWLVTPGFRGHFFLSGPDLAAMPGLAGLATGFLLLARQPVARKMAGHERT